MIPGTGPDPMQARRLCDRLVYASLRLWVNVLNCRRPDNLSFRVSASASAVISMGLSADLLMPVSLPPSLLAPPH